MTKKFIVIGLVVILFAGVTTAAVLFFFPYKTKQQPPQINDNNSTQQGIKVEQNTSTTSSLTSSLILSINVKDNYKVNEYLTGDTYNLSYNGPSFDAVILYKQSFTASGTVPGVTMSYVAYDIDFRNINTGGFISDIKVLSPAQIKIEINEQKGQIVNVFSNEGKYVLSMSVYKCSDIVSIGKCSAENISTDQILKQEPLKSVSKTIIVKGKAVTTAPTGKTILDCFDANYNVKDAACGLNFTDSFEKNLRPCTPYKGTVAIGVEPIMQIFRSYNILGVKNNLCVIEFSFLKTRDIPLTLLDKIMTCKYGDSERTIEKVAKAENCTGPLLDEFNKLSGQ